MRYGLKRGFFIDESNNKIKEISKTMRFYSKNLLFRHPFYIQFSEYKIKGNKKTRLIGLVKYKNDRFYLPSPKKFNTKQRIKLVGKFLGYPKCCVEQFIKDFDYNSIYSKQIYIPSYYSGVRFIKQLKKFHTNYFGIKMENTTVFSPILDYVPCNPKCKDSLKLLNFIIHTGIFFQNIAEEINKLDIPKKEYTMLCNLWHKKDIIMM